MRRARFRVVDLDDPRGFNGVQVATVTVEVDGANAVVRVRPLRRKKEYVMTLASVAKRVIWANVMAEAAERRRSRKRAGARRRTR